MRALSLRVRFQSHYVRILPPSAPAALWLVAAHGLYRRIEYASPSLVDSCSVVNLAGRNGKFLLLYRQSGRHADCGQTHPAHWFYPQLSSCLCGIRRGDCRYGIVARFLELDGLAFLCRHRLRLDLGDRRKRLAAER
ncbi:hypothetical protein D3C72_1808270 [compost metagenome]